MASHTRSSAISVGAIIRRNGKYLLFDRVFPPYGFTFVAGHVEKHQTPEQALYAEVTEESSLAIISCKKLFEEYIALDRCSFHDGHYWHVYSCTVQGRARIFPQEAKSMGWYTIKQIKGLKLTPVVAYTFKKLGVIQ